MTFLHFLVYFGKLRYYAISINGTPFCFIESLMHSQISQKRKQFIYFHIEKLITILEDNEGSTSLKFSFSNDFIYKKAYIYMLIADVLPLSFTLARYENATRCKHRWSSVGMYFH